jgi:hypothetical protein
VTSENISSDPDADREAAKAEVAGGGDMARFDGSPCCLHQKILAAMKSPMASISQRIL